MRIIETKDAPAAIGPYSQAIVAGGIIYTSGQIPIEPTSGVIGAMAGVIGSLQALEAVKYITGAGELLTGKLLTFDAMAMKFHTVKLPPRGSGCAVCADSPAITELIDYDQPACDLKARE